jgi:hypothetical protein
LIISLPTFSLHTPSLTIPCFDCFPAHLSSSLSWFHAAYTCTSTHAKEVNLCLNCTKQNSQTISNKQFVPPSWPDHFVRAPLSICQATLRAPHFNQEGNWCAPPFQSVRQLCASPF